MSANPKRPRRQSLTQQCVASMKQHIQQRQLAPGDRLPTEQEWAEMLGVSRLVVREALQALAGIGLIEIRQGRGTFLRDIAESGLFDQLTFGLDLQLTYTNVFEARAMLDLAVLELCMQRATPEAVAALEKVLEAMQAAEMDSDLYRELHREFHRHMLRAAGNPLLERIGSMLIETFWQISEAMPTLVYPSGRSQAEQIASHRDLVNAIKQGDLSQSRALVSGHLPVPPGTQHLFPVAFSAGMAEVAAGLCGHEPSQ